jgi:hypothetical protein
MTRALALFLFVAALALVAAPGCQKSSEVSNPKIDLKGKAPPIQPVAPGGVPGHKGAKQGPSGSST